MRPRPYHPPSTPVPRPAPRTPSRGVPLFAALIRVVRRLLPGRRPPRPFRDLARDVAAAVSHPMVLPLLRRLRDGAGRTPLALPLAAALLAYDRAGPDGRRAMLADLLAHVSGDDSPAAPSTPAGNP